MRWGRHMSDRRGVKRDMNGGESYEVVCQRGEKVRNKQVNEVMKTNRCKKTATVCLFKSVGWLVC